MDRYVGIDVSLDQSSVCVADATGKVIVEAKVASEPQAWRAEVIARIASMPMPRLGGLLPSNWIAEPQTVKAA